MTDKTLITVHLDDPTTARIEGIASLLGLTQQQVCERAITESAANFYHSRKDDPAEARGGISKSAQDWCLIVKTALSNNLSVQKMLGSPPRAYHKRPDKPVYPYLTYKGCKQKTLSLHIWSQFPGRAELDKIMTALSSALGTTLPISIIYSDIFRAADGRTLHGIIKLERAEND